METLRNAQTDVLSYEAELLRELRAFRDLMETRGTRVVTHTDRALSRFRSMPSEEQFKILSGFRSYSQLVMAVVSQDPECLRDETKLLRGVFKYLKLMVSEEFFATVDKDTIVEVYDTNYVQVYRSLGFMDVCSYSLLDLLTHAFFELYERSTSVNEYIISSVDVLMKRGTQAGVSLADIPKHLMRERFSEQQGVFQIHFDFMYPVYRWPNEFHGVIATQRAIPYRDVIADDVRFI